MQQFLTAAADRAEKLKNSYIDWQRDLLTNPLKVQTTKDPKDPKNAAVTTLLSTFLCLQCNVISSSKDREMHGQTKKHHMCRSYLALPLALLSFIQRSRADRVACTAACAMILSMIRHSRRSESSRACLPPAVSLFPTHSSSRG